jgi:drug/metabolite transporter (DMT)-like permease
MAAIIAAAVCAAAAGVASKRHGNTLHAATLNAPAMLVGSIVLGVAAIVSGEGLHLPTDVATWAAIAYLAIAGSVVTFLVYFSLLKTWSVTSLSFIAVFTPAIALVLGFVFLDERPTLWTGLGAVLILAGVTLALSSKKKGGSERPAST